MVQVWRIDIDAELAADDTLAALLDAQERHRAARFVRAVDRRRFLVSHAALRRALALHCDTPPNALVFEQGPFGKPRLTDHHGDIQFSLSHSGACALVAIALHQEVGVDVEVIRPRGELDGLVRMIMTPRERTAWQSLPEDERLNAFHTCWTRKEAVLKAAGTGLHVEPGAIETDFEREDVALVRHPAGTEWQVVDINIAAGFAAAIAMPTAMPIKYSVFPPLQSART